MYGSEDWARTITVTRAEAEREIIKHDCDFADFTRSHGDKPEYPGHVVLDWLGY